MPVDNNPELTGEEQPNPPPTERRSVVRRALSTAEQVQTETDWLKNLDERIQRGELTEDQKATVIARHVIANRRLTERADIKSTKDPMTGLLNKGAYNSEYSLLIESGAQFGLLIIDIDHFKHVNDTHGHLAGDRVLILTGKDLVTNLRQERPDDKQNDKVFRYGGEEIAVLLPGVTDEEDLMKIAEKLRTAIGKDPYSIADGDKQIEIPITVSVGGGIYRGQDKDEFFKAVDKQALYQAKETGRNKTVIISS